jgi:hypothetical protein
MRQRRVPGRRRDRVRLLDQRRRRRELAGHHVPDGQEGERERQRGQRPGVAGEPDLAAGERGARLVVPQ